MNSLCNPIFAKCILYSQVTQQWCRGRVSLWKRPCQLASMETLTQLMRSNWWKSRPALQTTWLRLNLSPWWRNMALVHLICYVGHNCCLYLVLNVFIRKHAVACLHIEQTPSSTIVLLPENQKAKKDNNMKYKSIVNDHLSSLQLSCISTLLILI